jgi:hypothetical protein
MKTYLIITSLILLFACQAKTSLQNRRLEKVIDITDKHGYFEMHVKPHDEMDVVIYKVDPNLKLDMNYGYAIVIYQNKKNEKAHRFDFMVGSSGNYDKAIYRWENDTILKLRLYSSTNANSRDEFTHILRKDGGEIRREPYN